MHANLAFALRNEPLPVPRDWTFSCSGSRNAIATRRSLTRAAARGAALRSIVVPIPRWAVKDRKMDGTCGWRGESAGNTAQLGGPITSATIDHIHGIYRDPTNEYGAKYAA